ncbi:MAG: DUF2752 domain-containing protein, partial [Acidobacteriaceae bacterium]|nr:DUF2752 domain-containing protein [Acidobacteriaceae bacterium]
VPVCVFHLLTGLPCPLCGLTHSVGATLTGQISIAIRLHVLGPAVVIANWCAAVFILVRLLKKNRRMGQQQPD